MKKYYILYAILAAVIGYAVCDIAKSSKHVCVDAAHAICDGHCECDGFGCPKPTITVIDMHQDNEGRPLYSIKTDEDQVYTYLYAEEIAQGLLTGNWDGDESLRLFPQYQYQLTLDPDTLVVTDFDRHVASIPYNKLGVLEDILIKDNE